MSKKIHLRITAHARGKPCHRCTTPITEGPYVTNSSGHAITKRYHIFCALKNSLITFEELKAEPMALTLALRGADQRSGEQGLETGDQSLITGGKSILMLDAEFTSIMDGR